jgi:hypothetical protein
MPRSSFVFGHRAQNLAVEVNSKSLPMRALDDGWFELTTREAGPGTRYQFTVDRRHKVPDPASRHQPSGLHGPGEVIPPGEFEWQQSSWNGCPWEETILYELHLGIFSPEGTFAGAERKLDYVAELGTTAIELMPLSTFPGQRNWGYDGVLPYALAAACGRPDELKRSRCRKARWEAKGAPQLLRERVVTEARSRWRSELSLRISHPLGYGAIRSFKARCTLRVTAFASCDSDAGHI